MARGQKTKNKTKTKNKKTRTRNENKIKLLHNRFDFFFHFVTKHRELVKKMIYEKKKWGHRPFKRVKSIESYRSGHQRYT